MLAPAPVSLGAALAAARQQPAPSGVPALDAQVWLARVIGRSRAWILAHPEAVLQPAEAEAFHAGLARLAAGEPLPYLLGEWEFYGRPFAVSPAVLIPRPETELLVETALAWLEQHPDACEIADIGTGSGCIAVTLAAETGRTGAAGGVRLTATDLSPEALAVARQNAARHRVSGQIAFVEADLLTPVAPAALPERFDLVCANLPYIPSALLPGLAVSRREPALALDGGPGGLQIISRLLAALPGRISPRGLILCEIEAACGAAAHAAGCSFFPEAFVSILPDLAGRDRLLVIDLGRRRGAA